MPTVSQETINAIAERGQALYDAQIRPLVEETNKGKFLVMDVDTGEYEMDAEDLSASRRLLSRLPNATLYGVRIGSRVAYHLGGGRVSAKQ